MFTTYDTSPLFKELSEAAKAAFASLVEDSSLEPETLKFPRDSELAEQLPFEDSLFLVKEGYLKCSIEEKMIFFLEKGDVFGLGDYFAKVPSSITSEFVVSLERFSRSALVAELSKDQAKTAKWCEYIDFTCASQMELIRTLTRHECRIEPETLVFSPGDTIIVEGTEAEQVFTLLQGCAEVYHGEQLVGEILDGEIFGAMAVATNTRRTASVVAKSSCVVFAVAKENFLALVETHPETAFRLVESMSRVIVSQNKKLAGY